MKIHFLIFGVTTFALLFAIHSLVSSATALNVTNATVVKTPANATVFLENGVNVSQPRTPLLMPEVNTTAMSNITNTNITGR